jgi:hypothetical protein
MMVERPPGFPAAPLQPELDRRPFWHDLLPVAGRIVVHEDSVRRSPGPRAPATG